MADPADPKERSDDVDARIRAAFRTRARVHVELGRLHFALVRALPLGVIAGCLAVAADDTRVSPAVAAVAVLAFVVVTGWKSRGCLWGGLAGLALGVLPLVCGRVLGFGGVTACCSGCSVGGLVAGAAIGFFAKRARFPMDVVAGALGGAALHLAIGCASAGAMEALGLLAGVVMGAAPVLAWRRAHS